MKESKKIKFNSLADSINKDNEDIRNFMYLCAQCSKPVQRFTHIEERPCSISFFKSNELVLCTNEECSAAGRMGHTSICNPDYDPDWYKSAKLSEDLINDFLKFSKEFTENNEHKT